MEKKEQEKYKKIWIFFFIAFIFGYNAIKFILTDGSDHPLVSSLFSMIISLAALIFFFHEKYGKYIIRQTRIEEYFKIKKRKNN